MLGIVAYLLLIRALACTRIRRVLIGTAFGAAYVESGRDQDARIALTAVWVIAMVGGVVQEIGRPPPAIFEVSMRYLTDTQMAPQGLPQKSLLAHVNNPVAN